MPDWRALIRGKTVCIITNETIAPLYLETMKLSLSDFDVMQIILPDGEQHKTMATFMMIVDTLCERHCPRDTTLIALGGGVVGDITGFAAATYHRGIPFIQVPTTLLAQVDSSIGGKTAVNHPAGKNLVGAFHQPHAVLVDYMFLATLPQREYVSGLAEVVKAALIYDADYWQWLLAHVDALLARETDVLAEAVFRSCDIKRQIVERDERESMRGGVRQWLNFGHTFAHAIEQSVGYGEWLHGEAVGLGMHIASQLSSRVGLLSSDQCDVICHGLERFGFAQSLPKSVEVSILIQRMQHDKKVYNNKLNLILLEHIGAAVIHSDISYSTLERLLMDYI